MLALDRLFATDYEDGSLDLLDDGPLPLELAVAAKAIAHWLTTGLPLVIIAPVLGLMLNVDMHAMGWVALTLLAGTPALTFIGLIGAALAVTLRRGGLLLAVLVLPLTIPVLIFGVAAANAAIVGPVPFGPPFTILCALSWPAWCSGHSPPPRRCGRGWSEPMHEMHRKIIPALWLIWRRLLDHLGVPNRRPTSNAKAGRLAGFILGLFWLAGRS